MSLSVKTKTGVRTINPTTGEDDYTSQSELDHILTEARSVFERFSRTGVDERIAGITPSSEPSPHVARSSPPKS